MGSEVVKKMISVIVPYKNSKEWIGRCILSLMKQEGDAEFILVNDHSKDGGKALVKKLTGADSRFVLLDNKQAAGVSGARNTGLDAAKGEWITFLDADDELIPEALQVFGRMAWLGRDPEVNILQANHMRCYRGDKTALKYANNKGVYTMAKMPLCWCMVWNKLIRRSFIEEHHIRFVEGLQYGEDEIFVLDMIAKDNKIIHTQTNTVTVMRHFDNKQSLSHIKGKEGLLTQARALEEYIMRTDNPEARITACKVLSEHWGSPTYIKAFGSDEKEMEK